MEENMLNNVQLTGFFGTVYPDEIAKFDYFHSFFEKENNIKYRLCKIKFFLGEKNGKEIILGLQAFYQDRITKKIKASEESRDITVEVFDTRILEIPPNDYICNFFLKTGDERITQIKLMTKRKRVIVVDSEEGEEKVIDYLNNNTNFIVLGFMGGYRKCLEVICASYIPVNDYYILIRGYFELKRKIRDKNFKNNIIESGYNQLSESDKALFRVCCLNDELFHSVMKFVLF